MNRNDARRNGFSFAELMSAVLVLSVGLLPILWFFSRTNAGTQKTRDEAMAWQYASELLDYATMRGYDGNAVTSAMGDEVKSIEIAGEKTAVDDRFTRRLIVRQLDPQHSEWPCAYRTLTAVVTWTAETQQRKLSLTGMLYATK